jgi:hypothetical protein
VKGIPDFEARFFRQSLPAVALAKARAIGHSPTLFGCHSFSDGSKVFDEQVGNKALTATFTIVKRQTANVKRKTRNTA